MREWNLRLVLGRACVGWGRSQLPLVAGLPSLRPLERQLWRTRDVDLLAIELDEYVDGLGRCRIDGGGIRVRPSSPFKGLSAFDDSDLDALFFFGREREREVIVANAVATRLTVLYGDSGVGKSSILRAGVLRRLRELEPDARVAVFDTWSDDVSATLADARLRAETLT